MRRICVSVLVGVTCVAAFAGFASGTAEANGQACGAGANGSTGYAYAGNQATKTAHGVRATITATAATRVSAGHVAGWVGVGGPAQGAGGSTMWLQVGVASLPQTPMMMYAEITRGGNDPVFVPLLQDVKVGESHRVAVLEMSGRPNWWRAWLDGQPVTEPVLLEDSTNRWHPIATAESWNGGQAVCNGFAFRFDGVGVASATGGSWKTFVPGAQFLDRGFAVRSLSGKSGVRTLAAEGPKPYAFEASSVSLRETR